MICMRLKLILDIQRSNSRTVKQVHRLLNLLLVLFGGQYAYPEIRTKCLNRICANLSMKNIMQH